MEERIPGQPLHAQLIPTREEELIPFNKAG